MSESNHDGTHPTITAQKRIDSEVKTEEQTSPPNSQITTSSPNTSPVPTQMLLEEAIRARHSTRLFLPTPVPRTLLDRALDLAGHAPSSTNTQPWCLFIVTGDALTRLKASLVSAASSLPSQNPALPASFAGYRAALGEMVFGEGWGLSHDDAEGRQVATMRNYEFFGAPLAVILCMSNELPGRAALCVGMFLQNFVLALTEVGVGSCVQVSVAGYPDVIRREVGIRGDLRVLVGVAVGYEDLRARVNQIRVGRDGVGRNTFWVGE